MLINDVVCCKYSQIHLYADDVQIYLSRTLFEIKDLATCLNSDLSRISAWSENICLTINNANTKAMSISQNFIQSPPKMILTDSTKNLGFFINSRLSCETHVNYIVSRIYRGLRKLWISASFLLNISLKLKLIRTRIRPFLTYMANVYGNLNLASSRYKLLFITAPDIYTSRGT